MTTSSPSGVRSSRSMMPRSRMSPTRASSSELDADRGDLVRDPRGRSSCPTSASASARSCSASARRRGPGPGTPGRPGARPRPGPARPGRPRACGRPGPWCQNSRSSTRWTKVPLTVQIVGSSGRWSMALNRKARAQSRNEVTLDGERDRGGSKGTGTDYGRGVSVTGTRSVKARATESATSAGAAAGPKWPMPGRTSTAGPGHRRGVGLEEARAEGVGLLAAAQRHRAARSRARWAKAPWEPPWA